MLTIEPPFPKAQDVFRPLLRTRATTTTSDVPPDFAAERRVRAMQLRASARPDLRDAVIEIRAAAVAGTLDAVTRAEFLERFPLD